MNAPTAATMEGDDSTTGRVRRRRRSRTIHQLKTSLLHFIVAVYLCFFCCEISVEERFSESACNGCALVLSPIPAACAQETKDEDRKGTVRRTAEATQTEKPQPSVVDDEKQSLGLNEILIRAGKRGLGGGISGALAGVIQVITLMWLRTIINYQCRYGTTFMQAITTLLNDGGIGRLYRGVTFALVQAPVARFVSTAVNDGVETFMASFELTSEWGPGRTTIVASIVVGVWRILLMPIDTMKTVLQVDSAEGFRSLMRRVRAGKINVLYSGACATAVSAILGHYPWFYTYNWLSTSEWVHALLPSQLLRNAGIGFVASIVSDTFINAIRVVKTTKQALGSKHAVSYGEVIRMILAADGWIGLFGRGLQTRIFANAFQSIVFTVIWRGLAERWKRKGTEVHQETS